MLNNVASLANNAKISFTSCVEQALARVHGFSPSEAELSRIMIEPRQALDKLTGMISDNSDSGYNNFEVASALENACLKSAHALIPAFSLNSLACGHLTKKHGAAFTSARKKVPTSATLQFQAFHVLTNDLEALLQQFVEDLIVFKNEQEKQQFRALGAQNTFLPMAVRPTPPSLPGHSFFSGLARQQQPLPQGRHPYQADCHFIVNGQCTRERAEGSCPYNHYNVGEGRPYDPTFPPEKRRRTPQNYSASGSKSQQQSRQ